MFFLRRVPPVLLILCLWMAPLGGAQGIDPDDDFLLHGMASLGQHASFHTDFTFDNGMLRELARGLPEDEEAQRILGNLNSITVHIYRYPKPGLYDRTELIPLRDHYRGPAWKHLVAAGPKGVEKASRTDLWVRYKGGNVEAMKLLVAKPKTLDLVEINGSLSPLDLLNLRGHFGIPDFAADHFTSANGQQSLQGREEQKESAR